MTPEQQKTLNLIRKLNAAEFSNWFKLSEPMAWCQIESAFREQAYRREPSGVASYGLMQVLNTTAREFKIGNPMQLFQPEVGLRIGMKVARGYWDQLTQRLGREPNYEEWSDSYNRGVGGVLKEEHLGKDPADDAYPVIWDAAQQHWAKVLGEVPGAARGVN